MKLIKSQPIGIFDSGIGGLTVAHKIVADFPEEQIIYFGDTAHLPYGDKSDKHIRQYSSAISQFLIDKGCKLIVIACNTASSVAYEYLQNKLGRKVIFVNVVDPAVSGAIKDQHYHDIGVIGTKGTIHSNIYATKIKAQVPEVNVHSLATPLLAPMIEAGFFNNQISGTIIETYLEHETLKNVEVLILACTHYPLIKNQIENYFQNRVKVFDSTDFISSEVKKILKEQHLLNDNKQNNNQFYISDFTESFEKTTKIFFGEKIHLEFYPLWDN